MFGWMLDQLRGFWFRRSRMIFKYWDGKRTRLADPMVLYREIMAHDEFKMDDFKMITVKDLFPTIVGRLAKVSRDVFKLKTAEDGGLTDMEAVQNLRAFIEYSGLQKKSTESPPTSLPSTEPNVSPDSQVVSVTNEPLDCCSTSTESQSGTLSELPQASASASAE